MRRTLLILLLASTAHAANEINAFCSGVTTAYAVVRQANGNVWYVTGQALEAWGTGGRTAADYDLALTDKSGGLFVGDLDTNLPAGNYTVAVHQQAGVAPADTDPVIWIDEGTWDGSTFSRSGSVRDIAVAVRAEMDANSVMLSAIKAMTDLMSVNTTTIATVDANDPNERFTLTAGQDVNDAYWQMAIMVEDATDSHSEVRWIEEYTTSRSVQVDEPFSFDPAPGDKAWILGPVYGGLLQQIVSGLNTSKSPIYYFKSGSSGSGPGGTTYLNESGEDP